MIRINKVIKVISKFIKKFKIIIKTINNSLNKKDISLKYY